MTDYKDTRIWKRSIGAQGNHQNERNYLQIEFEKVHKNAQILAGEIIRFLPDFTVHDISHLDALWKMTDIFLPDEYDLNPAEVFVLGVSFLLHDLGMGLSAYPKGMNGIQKEPLWRDTVASLCKKQNCKFDFEHIDTIDKDILRNATENTLRVLHAEKARALGTMSWSIESGESLYLIDHLIS